MINGHKFDLRIYVVVTCYDPLRVYVYKEGLARFASEPYNASKNNKYAHLTNYSINKKNENYIKSDVSVVNYSRMLKMMILGSNGVCRLYADTLRMQG